MSEFKVGEKVDGENLMLVLEGNIDEDVVFPPVQIANFKRIFLDLKGIKSINSVGIREWLNWIKPLAEKAQLVLMRCPKAMVFQFNMVEGFLPKNAVVKSFYVPFYCEKCDKEENVLFNIGQEIELTPGGYTIKYDAKKAALCGQADCEIEMDASEAKYFQFLKRMVGG